MIRRTFVLIGSLAAYSSGTLINSMRVPCCIGAMQRSASQLRRLGKANYLHGAESAIMARIRSGHAPGAEC